MVEAFNGHERVLDLAFDGDSELVLLLAKLKRAKKTLVRKFPFLGVFPHNPPWNRPNAWASISDMIRMPAPRTSTCWVLRRLKLPTRQTSR